MYQMGHKLCLLAVFYRLWKSVCGLFYQLMYWNSICEEDNIISSKISPTSSSTSLLLLFITFFIATIQKDTTFFFSLALVLGFL